MREGIEFILPIVVAAVVGSLFTLVVQWLSRKCKERRIRNTINAFLKDTIQPKLANIITEIPALHEYLYNYENQATKTFGEYPTLNPMVLESFRLDELQPVYGKKIIQIVNIIGIVSIPSNRCR